MCVCVCTYTFPEINVQRAAKLARARAKGYPEVVLHTQTTHANRAKLFLRLQEISTLSGGQKSPVVFTR